MSNSQRTSVPILVVDDEQIIAAALGEILRQANYPAVTTTQPLKALEELKGRDFSVIITDQRMPELSGLELLAQAKQLQPNATRILITGVLNLETVIDAINQGEIFRFILKPWIREEFLATVSNAVQRFELLCENSRLQATTRTIQAQFEKANALLEERAKLVDAQNRELADRNRAMESAFNRSLELCAHTLDAFLPALGAQTRCAVRISQALGASLELPLSEQRLLESAAMTCDIGLVRLPRELIRRWQENPDGLTPSETERIHQHPALSQEIAQAGLGTEEVGQIIRGHHERVDGQGYPDGLRGEGIPWLARLLGVAVAYAADNSSPEQALSNLESKAGSFFDPEAIRALSRTAATIDLPMKQKEVALKDLAPGMIVSCGIYSHNGLLLIPEGQRLDEASISSLASHHRVHPIIQSLSVYC